MQSVHPWRRASSFSGASKTSHCRALHEPYILNPSRRQEPLVPALCEEPPREQRHALLLSDCMHTSLHTSLGPALVVDILSQVYSNSLAQEGLDTGSHELGQLWAGEGGGDNDTDINRDGATQERQYKGGSEPKKDEPQHQPEMEEEDLINTDWIVTTWNVHCKKHRNDIEEAIAEELRLGMFCCCRTSPPSLRRRNTCW